MTWNQIEYFGRAIAYRQADGYLMDLAIAHNPWAGNEHKAGRLWRVLRSRANAAMNYQGRPMDQGMATKEQVEQGFERLRSMFGGSVKKLTISREEMAAKLAGSGARKLGR